MIQPIEAIIIACDTCREHYEDNNGFGVFTDKDAAIEKAKEDEWQIDGDTCHCPKCLQHK